MERVSETTQFYRSEKMVRVMLIGAVLAAMGLSGCAGQTADVHAMNGGAGPPGNGHPGDGLPGEPTYTIAWLPLPRAASTDNDAAAVAAVQRSRYEALLRDELAKYGLTEPATAPTQATPPKAHYLLSIAYDTRPAEVRVNPEQGPESASDAAPAPAFALFGGQVFRHSLTLRFFDRASGQEVYAVSAVSSDRNADPFGAMPALVRSAMARFPFAAPADWRVKLSAQPAGGAPEVVSVKPLTR